MCKLFKIFFIFGTLLGTNAYSEIYDTEIRCKTEDGAYSLEFSGFRVGRNTLSVGFWEKSAMSPSNGEVAFEVDKSTATISGRSLQAELYISMEDLKSENIGAIKIQGKLISIPFFHEGLGHSIIKTVNLELSCPDEYGP